jgi:AcrR family transcriptional regulator
VAPGAKIERTFDRTMMRAAKQTDQWSTRSSERARRVAAPARPSVRTINRTSGFDRKLDHVLAAGARVMSREGYGQATIRQVAGESGMSLAGLYHYFSSKEELLFLLQFHTFDSIVSALKAKLEAVTEPRERLRVLIANHLEHFLARMDELKVCAHEMESLGGEYYRRVQDLRRQYFRIALETVEAVGAQAGGTKVKARLATLYLFGMLNWIYMWYPAERGTSGDVLADELITLFLEGYLPRPAVRGGREKARKRDV